jgi:hypothetical protein
MQKAMDFVFDASEILAHKAGDINNPLWSAPLCHHTFTCTLSPPTHAVTPPPPIHLTRYAQTSETCYGAAVSAQGSTGVVFLLTHSGAFVVKASSRSAEEYFATRFMVEIGLPAIGMRVVNYVEPEWNTIKTCLRDGARTANFMATQTRTPQPGEAKTPSCRLTAEGLESIATRIQSAVKGPLDRPQVLHLFFAHVLCSFTCMIACVSALLSRRKFLIMESVCGTELEGFVQAKQVRTMCLLDGGRVKGVLRSTYIMGTALRMPVGKRAMWLCRASKPAVAPLSLDCCRYCYFLA